MPSFENSLHRLEQIVKKLEAGDLALDDALKLFEEGIQLSQQCQKQLEEAENKVEMLLKKADGKLVARKFSLEGDEAAAESTDIEGSS
ncbi:MAG TPA: exodeoxyribonuclease VII small subunit [Candidatus Acidoferrales bacterium]|nr:exodeoxyribonuclease VII small subunit [Candidatus Acidoferrales bacterium]